MNTPLRAVSYNELCKIINNLKSDEHFPEIFIRMPEKKPRTVKNLYTEVQSICKKHGMLKCFYTSESRVGWRRIKFMEYHRILDPDQVHKTIAEIRDLLFTKNLQETHSVNVYHGDCHGPYTAIVLKIKLS